MTYFPCHTELKNVTTKKESDTSVMFVCGHDDMNECMPKFKHNQESNA